MTSIMTSLCDLWALMPNGTTWAMLINV